MGSVFLYSLLEIPLHNFIDNEQLLSHILILKSSILIFRLLTEFNFFKVNSIHCYDHRLINC